MAKIILLGLGLLILISGCVESTPVPQQFPFPPIQVTPQETFFVPIQGAFLTDGSIWNLNNSCRIEFMIQNPNKSLAYCEVERVTLQNRLNDIIDLTVQCDCFYQGGS